MSSNKPSSEQLSSQPLGRGFSASGLDLWNWWQKARQEAIAATIPMTEVDWLLREVADVDRLALRLESFKEQPAIRLKLPLAELQMCWQRRVQERVPVQYLIGSTAWRQFNLKVSPAVLIPRPETECLIDLAVAAAIVDNASTAPHPVQLGAHAEALSSTPLNQGHWADLGTGSGAIALGLATAFPNATIHAVDCSEAALAIARSNAIAHGLADRIRFYHGSWFQPLQHLKGQLSGVVSNPPYIPSQMVLELQPEVTRHEPHLALDGGPDGLNCIRDLTTTAPAYLQPNGILLFEMMAGQAIRVAELIRQQGSYANIQIHSDLVGIERFALASKKSGV